MTGFGQGSTKINGKTFKIEIKSLNGKTTDMRMKCPPGMGEKEIILRKLILDHASRGKFDVNLTIDSQNGDDEFGLNVPLFKKYHLELAALAGEIELNSDGIAGAILRLPNVVKAVESHLSDDEWSAVLQMTTDAVDKLEDFRTSEGQSMKNDIIQRIETIRSRIKDVHPHEESRIITIKERIRKNLDQFLADDTVDKNRFEQEVLFYLEKLDITEEKVRLEQHCEYFKSILNNDRKVKGKKLSFIAQEMGREINTMGAKAQNSEIQKIVVGMKDELEKIKEQLANIL